MKVMRYMPEERLIERGVSALIKELGSVEATRFLMLRRNNRIESVRRHRRWQAGLKQSRFFDEIFGRRVISKVTGRHRS